VWSECGESVYGKKKQKSTDDKDDNNSLLLDKDYAKMTNADLIKLIDAIVGKYSLKTFRFNRMSNKVALTAVVQKAVEQAKVDSILLTSFASPC